jgi:putative addiction module antidote
MRKPKVVRSRRTGSVERSDALTVQSSKTKSGIKVIQIGTSMGAIFPKEMLARLKVKKGDILFTVETPDGVLLTPYDPQVEEQLAAGREFMREYRDTFRALAK